MPTLGSALTRFSDDISPEHELFGALKLRFLRNLDKFQHDPHPVARVVDHLCCRSAREFEDGTFFYRKEIERFVALEQ